ncbi:unnamed protein product [Closterium sp. NIES-53]
MAFSQPQLVPSCRPSSPRLSKLATPLLLSLLLLLHHSPLISAATAYGGVLPAANTLASPYSLHNGWFVFWLCTYNEDADTGEVSFTPFWFNGFQEDFPSPMDAALPPLGFYAVNGNCEYMVDSSCNIVQKGTTHEREKETRPKPAFPSSPPPPPTPLPPRFPPSLPPPSPPRLPTPPDPAVPFSALECRHVQTWSATAAAI